MAKYSYEFKIDVVLKFLNGKPLPHVAGVADKTILRYAQSWAKIYKEKGPELLRPVVFYRSYTLKEKVAAVKRINKGESMRAVARDLDMESHGTVQKWYDAYRKDGIAGLQYRKGIKPCRSVLETKPMKKKLSNSEREELFALRKRNQILECENDYLKKLSALISKKEGKDIKAKKQK